MPLGKPREEAERFARHMAKYGTEPPEERYRAGPSMETPMEILWSLLPCFPIIRGRWYPPIPRWMAAKIYGAGRRLK